MDIQRGSFLSMAPRGVDSPFTYLRGAVLVVFLSIS
jgi:hypothetical protein